MVVFLTHSVHIIITVVCVLSQFTDWYLLTPSWPCAHIVLTGFKLYFVFA